MPFLLDSAPIGFRNRPLLFIDFEMTGLDPAVHEIVEVAALIVHQEDLTVTNSYYTKVLPEHVESADPRSLRITRYNPSDWQDAIPLRQMLVELSELAPNCMLGGWCVQNEWDFLNAAMAREDLPYFYSHHLLEVYTLAYARFFREQSLEFLNLPQVAKALGIYLDNHKPDSDIRVTFEIFRRLSGLVS